MNINAYGYGVRKKDLTLIQNMVAVLGEEYTAQVKDLKSYECNPEPDDIVFLFGQRAINACADKKCRAKIDFPELGKLDPALGETLDRTLAYKRLLILKDALSSIEDFQALKENTKLSENNLPDLTADQVKTLEDTLRKKGETVWKGITRDGKRILVSVEPTKDESCDLNLTFSELYAVKVLAETLGVRELEIVTSTNHNREDNP